MSPFGKWMPIGSRRMAMLMPASLYTRGFVVRKFGLDDYFIIVAVVSVASFTTDFAELTPRSCSGQCKPPPYGSRSYTAGASTL